MAKKLKRVAEKEEEPATKKPKSDSSDEEDDEDLESIPEWNEKDLPEAPEERNEDEFQYKIIGEPDFVKLDKIAVTSSWVENATVFPADLVETNLSNLDEIAGFPSKLNKKIKVTLKKWFPVQRSVLPLLLKDINNPQPLRPRDVTISAPTGSGKTLCYLLPILTSIGERPLGVLKSLIIVPAQALVHQIEEEFSRYNVYNASIIGLSGAHDLDKEMRKLHEGRFDVVISTPSRLMEHLTSTGNTLSLNQLRWLVVDEADQMGARLRLEWLDYIEKRSGGEVRVQSLSDVVLSRRAPRKILLSATISKDVEELHLWNLFKPCLFKATAKQSENVTANADHITGVLALPSSISHVVIQAEKTQHPHVLFNEMVNKDWDKILIFTNEKASSARLATILKFMAKEKFTVDHLTSELYGNRRAKVLKRFKSGTTKVLICSDVLARGVDVTDVSCVINYDLPPNDRAFIHRAGRTGRAGKSGSVISIGDKEKKRTFVRMLKKSGLLTNCEEKEVKVEDLQETLPLYEESLEMLKKSVTKTNGVNGNTKNVSGFEHRRHRLWIPGLKEKREQEKEKLKLQWKSKKRID